MTQQHHEALQLFRDLVDDLRDPNFVWQVVTLAACVGAAWLFARWWIGRHHQEGAGRLKDAGARLAFPLTAVALVGIARLVLQQFIHVNLFRLALPLLGSMALVRAVVFVLRQAFPKATWLTAWERIIATFIWGWLALYITDLAPDVIAVLEDVVFPLGAQRLNLWMVLQVIVTGQQWPASTCDIMKNFAARATCAPDPGARHGAACRPAPSEASISAW